MTKTEKEERGREASQAYKRGAFPHECQEDLDDPVELTIMIERYQYQFLKGLCDSDSFLDSVQMSLSNLIRACGRDGLDLEFMKNIIDAVIEDDPSKRMIAPETPLFLKAGDDEIPF